MNPKQLLIFYLVWVSAVYACAKSSTVTCPMPHTSRRADLLSSSQSNKVPKSNKECLSREEKQCCVLSLTYLPIYLWASQETWVVTAVSIHPLSQSSSSSHFPVHLSTPDELNSHLTVHHSSRDHCPVLLQHCSRSFPQRCPKQHVFWIIHAIKWIRQCCWG